MTTTTRRLRVGALAILSLVAVLGPIALLARGDRVGAAFGDNDEFGPNHLGAATLDLEVGPSSARLTAAPMAPGDTVTGWLDLSNAGTLDLHYAVLAENGDDLLIDWLRWDVWVARGGCDTPQTRLRAGITLQPGATDSLIGSAAPGFGGGERILAPGGDERICLSATLPADAPNELQGRAVSQDLIVVAEHHLEAAS